METEKISDFDNKNESLFSGIFALSAIKFLRTYVESQYMFNGS